MAHMCWHLEEQWRRLGNGLHDLLQHSNHKSRIQAVKTDYEAAYSRYVQLLRTELSNLELSSEEVCRQRSAASTEYDELHRAYDVFRRRSVLPSTSRAYDVTSQRASASGSCVQSLARCRTTSPFPSPSAVDIRQSDDSVAVIPFQPPLERRSTPLDIPDYSSWLAESKVKDSTAPAALDHQGMYSEVNHVLIHAAAVSVGFQPNNEGVPPIQQTLLAAPHHISFQQSAQSATRPPSVATCHSATCAARNASQPLQATTTTTKLPRPRWIEPPACIQVPVTSPRTFTVPLHHPAPRVDAAAAVQCTASSLFNHASSGMPESVRQTDDSRLPPCPECIGRHHLYRCERFKTKSDGGRLKLVNECCLCWNYMDSIAQLIDPVRCAAKDVASVIIAYFCVVALLTLPWEVFRILPRIAKRPPLTLISNGAGKCPFNVPIVSG